MVNLSEYYSLIDRVIFFWYPDYIFIQFGNRRDKVSSLEHLFHLTHDNEILYINTN
jgi:hypothetical protein